MWATFEEVDETGGFQNAKLITLGKFPALFFPPVKEMEKKITLGKFSALFFAGEITLIDGNQKTRNKDKFLF
jgi:hypothetical protein